MKITEEQAGILIDGFQSGGIDAYDLMGIFEDPGFWLENSETDYARRAWDAEWPNEQLTCDTCGRVGNRDDGIEPGGPCQEPCEGTVRRVSETCSVCGQPDNCGDCDHTPLTDEDWEALS